MQLKQNAEGEVLHAGGAAVQSGRRREEGIGALSGAHRSSSRIEGNSGWWLGNQRVDAMQGWRRGPAADRRWRPLASEGEREEGGREGEGRESWEGRRGGGGESPPPPAQLLVVFFHDVYCFMHGPPGATAPTRSSASSNVCGKPPSATAPTSSDSDGRGFDLAGVSDC